jgi:hypothetical protein
MLKVAPASPAPSGSSRTPRAFLPDDFTIPHTATPDACGCRCDDEAMERHLFALTPRQRAELLPRPAEVAAIARGADIERRMRLGLPVTSAPCRWWAAFIGWRNT